MKKKKKNFGKICMNLTNKPKRHTTPSLSNQEGESILRPEESANAFNDFFTSVFQQFNTDNSGTF